MREPSIGVDLGGTKIEALLLDGEGCSLWRETRRDAAGRPQRDAGDDRDLVERAERETGL